MKRIFSVFLVILAICVMSAAGFASDHTMLISTDKDVYEVGEKFNVSVVVVLANDETIFSISSVISFDHTALSVDNSRATTNPLLRTIILDPEEGAGLSTRFPLADPIPTHIIGGAITSMEGNEAVPAGTYVVLRNAVFEAVTPGVYELILPEDTSYPDAKTSFLVKRAIGDPPSLLLVPSTKINKMITITQPEEAVIK